MANKERLIFKELKAEISQSKKSLKEKALEISQWIDKWGIRVGLAMTAFGIIYNPILVPGLVLTGSSFATLWIAEKIRQKEEKKRLQKMGKIYARGTT